jgi:hypothetical protein
MFFVHGCKKFVSYSNGKTWVTGEERAVETIGSKGERASRKLEKITVREFVLCTIH